MLPPTGYNAKRGGFLLAGFRAGAVSAGQTT